MDDPVEVGREDAVFGALGQAGKHLAPLLCTVRKLFGVLVEQAAEDLDAAEARLERDLRRERDRRRQRFCARLRLPGDGLNGRRLLTPQLDLLLPDRGLC